MGPMATTLRRESRAELEAELTAVRDELGATKRELEAVRIALGLARVALVESRPSRERPTYLAENPLAEAQQNLQHQHGHWAPCTCVPGRSDAFGLAALRAQRPPDLPTLWQGPRPPDPLKHWLTEQWGSINGPAR
jgi:hypothetical protein